MGDRGFREKVLSDVSRALGKERGQPLSIPEETKSEESQCQFSSFAEEFGKVGGRLFETDLPSKVAEYVVNVIDSQEITEVALSDAAILEEVSLDQRIREHLGVAGNVVRVDRSIEKEDLIRILDNVELGITSCRFAISETGTMVLETDSETCRLLSLLQPFGLSEILRPGGPTGARDDDGEPTRHVSPNGR